MLRGPFIIAFLLKGAVLAQELWCSRSSRGMLVKVLLSQEKTREYMYAGRTEGQVGTQCLMSPFFQTGAPGQDSLPSHSHTFQMVGNIHTSSTTPTPGAASLPTLFPIPHPFLSLASEDISPIRFPLASLTNPPGQGSCRESELFPSLLFLRGTLALHG